MTRIFDILNRGKGEIADAIRPMVETDQDQVSAVPTEKRETPVAVPEAIRTLRFHLPAPSPLLPFEE